MGIDLSLYVQITSAQGAGSQFSGRQFIARVMTTNPLVPTGSIVTFSGGSINALAACAAYFGTSSEEYKRAAQYFNFVSKVGTAPQAISFGRWADVATAPEIFGKKQTPLLGTFTAITAGSFTLQIGAFTHTFTAIDLSGAASLTAVAADIQTAVRTYSAGGTLYTAATVTWNSSRGSFDLVAGAPGPATISVTAAVSNDLASPLGWLSGAIFSNGVNAETITDTLDLTSSSSNNFGSFCFTYTAALSLTEVEEAATWNIAQDVSYRFDVAVTADNASAWVAALTAFSGMELTLIGPANEYHEMIPEAVQASTVFTNPNSVQNYEYQTYPALTPTVTDTATAQTYFDLNINFLGAVQSAGQTISFYQQGVMLGTGVAITDMGAYANEQWFKNAQQDALINLQLALPIIPADAAGTASIKLAIQSVVNIGKNNGTIVAGKTLSNAEIALIGTITNDVNAYRQIQNIGYWINVVLATYQEGSVTLWKAIAKTIYADSEGIRFIQGSDILL